MIIQTSFAAPTTPDIPFSLTATGSAGAAVTLTIPAAPAGQFHFVYVILITKFATAALIAGAAPTTVTTTNLNNTPSLDFSTAADAQGTIQTLLLQPEAPLKTSAAATPTTIICPATTSVIWKVTAFWTQASN